MVRYTEGNRGGAIHCGIEPRRPIVLGRDGPEAFLETVPRGPLTDQIIREQARTDRSPGRTAAGLGYRPRRCRAIRTFGRVRPWPGTIPSGTCAFSASTAG